MKLLERRSRLVGASIGFLSGIFLMPIAVAQLFPMEEFQAALETEVSAYFIVGAGETTNCKFFKHRDDRYRDNDRYRPS